MKLRHLEGAVRGTGVTPGRGVRAGRGLQSGCRPLCRGGIADSCPSPQVPLRTPAHDGAPVLQRIAARHTKLDGLEDQLARPHPRHHRRPPRPPAGPPARCWPRRPGGPVLPPPGRRSGPQRRQSSTRPLTREAPRISDRLNQQPNRPDAQSEKSALSQHPSWHTRSDAGTDGNAGPAEGLPLRHSQPLSDLPRPEHVAGTIGHASKPVDPQKPAAQRTRPRGFRGTAGSAGAGSGAPS